MDPLFLLAVWVGKLAQAVLRAAGKSATSFPGKLAIRVAPRVLEHLGRQLRRCVVVTGTNGKTTTTNLLSAMLRQSGPLITNTEGANLQQGIVSAILEATSWFGRVRVPLAVLEVDEASLPLVAKYLPIRVLAVTNVFRDQLDRYGELDTTVQKIVQGIADTDAVIVLCADDPLAHHIGRVSGKRAVYFGLHRDMAAEKARDVMRDGAFCLQCGHELRYDGYFYGQLGLYVCPSCDFFRPHPDLIGRLANGKLEVAQGQLPVVSFDVPVRGLFNLYNELCAVTAARMCGLTAQQVATGLASFRAPLGRMQAFTTRPASVLNLVKNPAGCDGVLQAIASERGPKVLCIAINDQAADGRDVSWLWDADFELVPEQASAVRVITTGMRAEDMALRLKYAGYDARRTECIPNLDEGINHALLTAAQEGGLPVYVISTYTALYPAAQILRQKEAGPSDPVAQNRPSVS
ncbi:Mur ligase family protein [Alicyclobacillus sp. ALC3]|uniref:Mur ligase family protein n=1 Tax=Alicyclobacillus sp. ALC3 TaxID=2796143 RepID=UPI0023791088|nr:Mur ligase family protein [Alicyclobacillus sp. ALC3]WDL97976.1 DUF1727 domain-containing protein [Alicyclobacillus sp. ALC3]